MPAGQDTELEVEDCNDGRYILRLMLRAPCEVKVLISIARERPNPTTATMPGTVQDFPHMHLNFLSLKALQMQKEREAKKAAQMGDVSAFANDGAKGKLRQAVAGVAADARVAKADAPAEARTYGSAEKAAKAALSAMSDGSDLLRTADALISNATLGKLKSVPGAPLMDDMASMATRLGPGDSMGSIGTSQSSMRRCAATDSMGAQSSIGAQSSMGSQATSIAAAPPPPSPTSKGAKPEAHAAMKRRGAEEEAGSRVEGEAPGQAASWQGHLAKRK